MQLNIKVQNLAQFRAKMQKYPILIGRGLQEAIAKATFTAERGIKKAIVGGATRAFDTGNLFRSVRSSVSMLQGEVKAHADYSLYVHEGTKYMRARPFMTTGLDNSMKDIEDIVGKFIKTTLSKG
jgi:HK97 gp10 family phage protein